MKKRLVTRDRVFLVMIIVLVLGICLGFGNKIQTGYAVADCVDADLDGYYDEGCSLEDIGCENVEELVVDSNDKSSLDVDETYLVFVSNSEVYGYDLISGNLNLLSNSGIESLNPKVYDNYVVWQAVIFNYLRLTEELSTSAPLDEWILNELLWLRRPV